MNPLEKLYRADNLRKSRFHTATGTLCLHPRDMMVGLGSTIMRRTTGKLLDLPWLTFPAIRFLETLPMDLAVFEYGCGMSTGWYGRHFKEVHAVESNPQWFDRVKGLTRNQANVSIALHESETPYVEAIRQTECPAFDLVVIDGEWRRQCVSHALVLIRPGGYIMLDNSDVELETRNAIELFPSQRRLVFSGFIPGGFHVNETTLWQVK